MSKMKYIATLSGGKDSTVMCDLLLKNNYPVDYLIFNDTLIEHKEMYQYINKLEKYYPEVWSEMKQIENKLKKLQASGEKVIYDNWHLGESIEDLEKKFVKADKQGSLFDFSNEPLADCFCKI